MLRAVYGFKLCPCSTGSCSSWNDPSTFWTVGCECRWPPEGRRCGNEQASWVISSRGETLYARGLLLKRTRRLGAVLLDRPGRARSLSAERLRRRCGCPWLKDVAGPPCPFRLQRADSKDRSSTSKARAFWASASRATPHAWSHWATDPWGIAILAVVDDRRAPHRAAARRKASARSSCRCRAALGDPGAGRARHTACDPLTDDGPDRRRRRPRAERGAHARDHLAESRHAAPRAQRGFPLAAHADSPWSVYGQRAKTGSGGRPAGRRRACRKGHRAFPGRGGAHLTRQQLGARIAATGVRTEGQALVHLLALASLRGLAVRGPMLGGQHAYALVRDWLGEQPPVDRELALEELARRYLLGHGPADERDLARWSGPHCATSALDCARSHPSSHSAKTGSWTWPGAHRQRSCRHRACSAPSIPSCSAGAHARHSSAHTAP